MRNCVVKCFNMKILLLQLYFLIWSQTAETFTDRLTDLGQNVTIKCDLHEEEVFWFLLKLWDPPVMILRTFSSPFYHNERFTKKYSVKSKNHLFINNVTHDELGVYYCMSPETKSKQFSNGTRLHINGTRLHINESLNSFEKKQCPVINLISALMNGVLIIVVVGLLVALVRESKRTRKGLKQFQDIDPQELMNLKQLQDSTQTQYVQVEIPKLCIRF